MKERTFHTGHGVTSVCAHEEGNVPTPGRSTLGKRTSMRKCQVYRWIYYFMSDKDRQNGSNPILIMNDESTG